MSTRVTMQRWPGLGRFARYGSFALAIALVGASCGTASSVEQSTAETLGSAEAGEADLAFVSSTIGGEAPPPEPAPDPIGPQLSPGSTAEQIARAVGEVHGPTSDLSAQVNRFVEFPSIPTPPGTELVELRADVRESIDRDSIMTVAEVTLRADGRPDDLVGFYLDAFDQPGWELTTRRGYGTGESRLERLGFQLADSAFTRNDVDIRVTPADGETSRVQLRYSVLDPSGDISSRARFEGWVGDLPLPDGGEVIGAGVQTSTVGRFSLHLSMALRYADQRPADIAALLRSSLPVGGYELAPQPTLGEPLDYWVYFAHPSFDEVRASTHRVADGAGAETTTVNVDARIELSTLS